MGTATFRGTLALAALGIGVAACGSAGGTSSTGGSGEPAAVSTSTVASRPFAWLRAQAPPAGWHVVAIPSGASMAYPSTWQQTRGDPSTATAVLRDRVGHFLGYLNLTPRQGRETLSNWSSFRPEHNRDEGDQNVKLLAAAQGLRFLTGRGSCVKDSYTTNSHASYIEIACLVSGSRGGQFVIVGAAPPNAWGRTSPVIERAIEGVRT